MEIFSGTFKKVWNLWEIRSLVTLSLCLQIILIILGSRRKITNPHSRIGILLNVTIWCAYIAADWVATVALSVMASSGANSQYDSSKAIDRLQAFWAPFLLLHLGGPDNITAFSMEDNYLWLRHLLELFVQVGVAFQVFMRFWSSSALTFLAIPVLITGIVRYGERTWALWSSSTQFNYSQGSFPVASYHLIDHKRDSNNPEDHNLIEAYFSYNIIRQLFMDHSVVFPHIEDVYLLIREKSAEDAFKLVETEVGLMYDVLYTKADIVYSRHGICLRCISFICSICTLVLFAIIIDVHSYQLIEIAVTYLLLVGAVVLETYALIILLSSDWTKVWLISLRMASHNQISGTLIDNFQRFTNFLHSCLTGKKRWSECIGQYNLMSFVRKERKHTYLGLENLSCTSKLLEKYRYLSWENIDISLQETIFNYLNRIANELNPFGNDEFDFQREEYLSRRGEHALRDYEFCHFLVSEDYDARVIMWHIITDKFYEIELEHLKGDVKKLSQVCKIGKWLSDHMIYLLFFCPSIFPKGIGQLRYDHTCNHIASSLPNTYSVLESVKQLTSRLEDGEKDWNQRWEVIIEVWLELLTYAASYFERKKHTEYLRRGGELLILVSVLMIHFHLSKQIT